MSSISPFSSAQQGNAASSTKPSKAPAEAFDSFLDANDLKHRTHSFSELGMFGRASAVAYDHDQAGQPPDAKNAELRSSTHEVADHAPKPLRTTPIALSARSAEATAGQAKLSIQPPRDTKLGVQVETASAPGMLSQARSQGADANIAPVSSRKAAAPTVPLRPSRPAVALHLSEGDGGLQIVARLAHLAPAEADQVSLRLRQAAAELGYTTNRVTLNGAPVATSTPQAIGGQHGPRTR